MHLVCKKNPFYVLLWRDFLSQNYRLHFSLHFQSYLATFLCQAQSNCIFSNVCKNIFYVFISLTLFLRISSLFSCIRLQNRLWDWFHIIFTKGGRSIVTFNIFVWGRGCGVIYDNFCDIRRLKGSKNPIFLTDTTVEYPPKKTLQQTLSTAVAEAAKS